MAASKRYPDWYLVIPYVGVVAFGIAALIILKDPAPVGLAQGFSLQTPAKTALMNVDHAEDAAIALFLMGVLLLIGTFFTYYRFKFLADTESKKKKAHHG
ncbi:MAG: hypothetical protein ABIC95_02295 [archaeon]